MPALRRSLPAALAAAALAATGCGGGDTPDAGVAPATAPPAAPPAGATATTGSTAAAPAPLNGTGVALPSTEVVDLRTDQTLELSSIATGAKKPLLVWFWAPW